MWSCGELEACARGQGKITRYRVVNGSLLFLYTADPLKSANPNRAVISELTQRDGRGKKMAKLVRQV